MFVDHKEEICIHKAELIFAKKVGTALGAFRSLGMVPKFEFTSMGEDTQIIEDGRSTSGLPYMEIVKKIVPKFSCDLMAVNQENKALIFSSDTDEYTQAATAVVLEQLRGKVSVGSIYQLGLDTPARKITSIQALQTRETVPIEFAAYDPDTGEGHYIVDLVAGTIEIVALPDGVDPDDVYLDCSYTPTAIITGAGLRRVKAGNRNFVEGRLQAKGTDTNGAVHAITLWRVRVALSGAFGYVTSEAPTYTLEITVLQDDVHADAFEDIQITAPTPA